MKQHVSIESHGPGGTVTYHEAGNQLACYWEFGGADAVAIVQCGNTAAWARHPWALGRRADILRRIADAVVQQKAPDCRAEIDADTGDIVLRQIAPSPGSPSPGRPGAVESHWFFRLSTLRMQLGLLLLAGALLIGAGVWVKNYLFSINPGQGTAIGLSLRTDKHIATLIQTLEPYVPALNRNHGNDTYRISLFLVPLDGSDTHLIPVRSGLSASAFSNAKIYGSDGRTLWFNVAGIGGIDLARYQPLPDAEAGKVDPRQLPRPWGDLPFAPKPEHFLAAGLMISPTAWLGLHSDTEVQRDFQPGKWLKPVVRAENAKQLRRFHRAQLEADATVGYARILGLRALSDSEYLNAAFLRPSNTATPIRLDNPPGTLMLYTSAPGPQGSVIVARVDDAGKLLWQVDTGIDRFTLQQILPGKDSTAFVGRRPPVPDKVSEPLLVIIEHHRGRQATHSLWQ
jgi:hypothetical protein